MKIVNLTDHDITIMDANGGLITVPPSGRLARVEKIVRQAQSVNNIPVRLERPVAVKGLPSPEKGVVYLVSNFVLQQCNHRPDLYAPAAVEIVNGQKVAFRLYCTEAYTSGRR